MEYRIISHIKVFVHTNPVVLVLLYASIKKIRIKKLHTLGKGVQSFWRFARCCITDCSIFRTQPGAGLQPSDGILLSWS